jgi:uncharacterized protein
MDLLGLAGSNAAPDGWFKSKDCPGTSWPDEVGLNTACSSLPVSNHSSIECAIMLHSSVEKVVQKLAPTWPLDQFIAVNPMWGHVDRPMHEVAAWAASVKGQRLMPEHGLFQRAWDAGIVTRSHLCAALAEFDDPRTADELIRALKATHSVQSLPTLADILDARRDLSRLPACRSVVTHQISQVCAAFFDSEQAQWSMMDKSSLYRAWRKAMNADRGLGLLLGQPGLRDKAVQLPLEAEQMLNQAVAQLGIESDWLEPYLDAVLAPLNGWASWCAYERWQAAFESKSNDYARDLLAIGLAWECLLDDATRDASSGVSVLQTTWRGWRSHVLGEAKAQSIDAIWLRACEFAYQYQVSEGLKNAARTRAAANSAASVKPQAEGQFKAVFCIDVRSEVFRRALEQAFPAIETSGFAGFFGLPIAYTPQGTTARRPQLPGLLPPAIEVSDAMHSPEATQALVEQRQIHLSEVARRQRLSLLPGAAFSYVETAGLAYAAGLARNSLSAGLVMPSIDQAGLSAAAMAQSRPQLTGLDTPAKADLASKVLGAMSMTQDFPRMVLLAGHGSQTANNPHAAGLDCGACCGQTGEVNARVLAGILNDAKVRQLLVKQGIALGDCWFVAGLHNTTTDLMLLFDTADVPASHREDLRVLQSALAKAGELARAERAPALGLSSLAKDSAALEAAVNERARDWSHTRPEWGLANNAAFVIGPRDLTRSIDLQGRSFLHDYDWQRDADSAVLELLMTAPMLVTHWINFQYFASTVDPDRLGSGNKVLHNVVGGRIGVFEGNGGDLRIGLPLQSVHDGERWMHEPLRLSVFIAAPQSKIEAIINKHAIVEQLVSNQWIYLFQVDESTGLATRFHQGRWQAFNSPVPEPLH